MTCILKPPEVQISFTNPLHDLNTIISQFDGCFNGAGERSGPGPSPLDPPLRLQLILMPI